MIDAIKLLSFLKKKKVNFFSGVADSSLKAFTKELEKEIGIKHFQFTMKEVQFLWELVIIYLQEKFLVYICKIPD